MAGTILTLEEQRPSLEQILAHSFFSDHSLPTSLPTHSLYVQPALPATPPRPQTGACNKFSFLLI